jgi:hypothetical protein
MRDLIVCWNGIRISQNSFHWRYASWKDINNPKNGKKSLPETTQPTIAANHFETLIEIQEEFDYLSHFSFL